MRVSNLSYDHYRLSASAPCPGEGLALCGVGYDLKELAIHKHMNKETRKLFEDMFRIDGEFII
jgi:hypothetical protein